MKTSLHHMHASVALAAGAVVVFASSMFAPSAQAQSRTIEEVVALVNEKIEQSWADNQVTPSGEASDGEWVRRVYLDVLGRIPTVSETIAFLNDSDSDKKRKLVDRMFSEEKYTEELARNWTTIWTNVLIGRNGGGDESMANREGMQQYLRRSFMRNVPYDKMVGDLVTASGNSTPGQPDYNGAVNFLLNDIQLDVPANERTARVTANVARIFLGTQVQCTQCHNHPFNSWKQDQFWSFDAFFRQMQQVRSGGDGGPALLVDGDFAGESGNPANADIFYEQRNGLLKVAYPVFLDGSKIDSSGYLEDVNRRQELSSKIVASKEMPKALVNRMWQHYMGYGFTKPIDDMGPHNRASHPELLDLLAEEFAYDFDLRRLSKILVLTKPYSLSSRYNSSNELDDPELGNAPLFSHFYLRQMRAEELYGSLIVATEAQASVGDFKAQSDAKDRWLAQFITAFGTDEGGEQTTFNGTIPQALMMMNGDLMKQALGTQNGTFLSKLNSLDMSGPKKIDYIFLAALSRKPRRDEIRYANALWSARQGNAEEALKDIYWAVLNSNEFILNH